MDANVLKKISATAFVKLGSGALLFFLTMFVSRTMEGAEAGAFLWGLSFMSAIAILFRLGLDSVIMRAVACGGVDEAAQATLYRGLIWILLATSIFLFVALIAGDALLELVWASEVVENPLQIMLLALPAMSCFMALGFAFQGQQRVVFATIFQNLGVTALFLLSFNALLEGGLIESTSREAEIIFVICSWIMLLFALVAWFSGEGVSFKLEALWDRRQLVASGNLWAVSCMNVLANWSAIVMAAIFVQAEELAYLSAAQRTAMLASFILSIVNTVVAPRYAQLWSSGKVDRVRSLARNSTRAMILVMLPAFSLVIIFPSEIMRLFGSGFEAGATLLVIMALGQLVNVATGSVAYLLSMSGHERDLKRVTFISGPISIVSAVFFTSQWGVLGAAIATAVGLSAQNLGALWMVKRRLGFLPIG
ncbi:MATE family efflux transporter [Pseudomaricurvus sp. HS19]|uniref:MATE family efflux transporter n=1 Tax=Pseudomaricurvus sp. HS19 TaxID=2692626 RepID=UPI0013716A59|nr:MATE family efflux transporter [Pseudomaricurvus sp. HS19]MYM65129.1 oligosaccharide flippase family protein [Pseudomaricurvus sp. HS19]